MALVPGLNIGVGILVLIIIWIITMLAVIALAAVPKARFAKNNQISQACKGCGDFFVVSLKIWDPSSAASLCGGDYSATILSKTVC